MDADGLPIVASGKVPDEALFQAKGIIDDMLAHRPAIRAELVALGRRVTVVSNREVITDIPEFRDIYEKHPGTDWNARVQAGGLAGDEDAQTTAIWESNLLCDENDVYSHEDILVREFARTALSMGVERQPGGGEFRRRLEEAYREALDAGLWENTYAGANPDEYWAEGVQSWFGLNDRAIPANGAHNQINTRHELQAYDPTIANLVQEVFGDAAVFSSCHIVATSVDAVEPLTIEFLGGVSLAKQAEVRATVSDIRDFFDYLAVGKPAPDSIIVSYDQDMLKAKWRAINGYEYPGNICGVRASSLFVFLELPCGRPGVFVHELVHHYLQEATAPGHLLPNYGEGYSNHGPWWLTEGAAVYGEVLYEVSRGIASYGDRLEERINDAQRSTHRLAELETASNFFENTRATYALGFLAVVRLVQHSSDDALLKYYELLLEYDTWQGAFEGAFGISLDDFYASFEEYRAGVAPIVHSIRGTVLGPGGEPLEGIGIWAWRGQRDNSVWGSTKPDGTFSIGVPDGSFALAVYAESEAGWTQLGWYDGAEGLVAEESHAAQIVIDGADVEGIEIRLPG